ncbi:hypothetical protein AB0H31_31210, partial [Amycolatopsis japonica]
MVAGGSMAGVKAPFAASNAVKGAFTPVALPRRPPRRRRPCRESHFREAVELAALPGDGETQGHDLNGLDEVVGSA